MLTAHLNVPEGGAMLEEKTYTLPQLAQELGGAADRQSVLKKLQRRGIAYTAEGRGAKLKITIQSIPDRFPTYCIRELQFAPNSDFEKVRNLFYYCFNDEEFFTYPDERKAAALRNAAITSHGRVSPSICKSSMIWASGPKAVRNLSTTLPTVEFTGKPTSRNTWRHGTTTGAGKRNSAES